MTISRTRTKTLVMCAGYIHGGLGACLGDSGGPLVTRMSDGDGDYYLQTGVVHGSIARCGDPIPDIFARLEDQDIWNFIHQKIRPGKKIVSSFFAGETILAVGDITGWIAFFQLADQNQILQVQVFNGHPITAIGIIEDGDEWTVIAGSIGQIATVDKRGETNVQERPDIIDKVVSVEVRSSTEIYITVENGWYFVFRFDRPSLVRVGSGKYRSIDVGDDGVTWYFDPERGQFREIKQYAQFPSVVQGATVGTDFQDDGDCVVLYTNAEEFKTARGAPKVMQIEYNRDKVRVLKGELVQQVFVEFKSDEVYFLMKDGKLLKHSRKRLIDKSISDSDLNPVTVKTFLETPIVFQVKRNVLFFAVEDNVLKEILPED